MASRSRPEYGVSNLTLVPEFEVRLHHPCPNELWRNNLADDSMQRTSQTGHQGDTGSVYFPRDVESVPRRAQFVSLIVTGPCCTTFGKPSPPAPGLPAPLLS